MVEVGPIISLIKLLAEGLKTIFQQYNLSKEKEIQRKIVQIQLQLEGIIDDAIRMLTFAKEQKNNSYNLEVIDSLRNQLYAQDRKIWILINLLSDEISDKILKVFAPHIRRRIFELIQMKSGVINAFISKIHWLDDNQIFYPYAALYGWNHDRFVENGEEYARNIIDKASLEKIALLDLINQQEESIKELMGCSTELSNLIKTNISLSDII